MGNLRLYVLARELGLSSAELIEKLRAEGLAIATASSSIDDDLALRLRGQAKGSAGGDAASEATAGDGKGKPLSAKKALASKKTPPMKKTVAPTPAPKPIERRAKAVKPPRRKDLGPTEKSAAEERRRIRQARVRGEIPAELPTAVAESAGVAEPVAQPVEQAAEVVVETPAAPEPVHAPEATPAEPARLPEAARTGAPGTSGLQLPFLVEQRPVRRPEEPRPVVPAATTSAPSPAAATPPAESGIAPPLVKPMAPPPTGAPTIPVRGLREFRGPVRKIDLPPQPPQRGMQGRGPAPAAPPAAPGAQGAPGARPAAPGQGLTRTFSQRPGTGLGKSKKRRKEQAPAPVQPAAPIRKGEGQVIRLTEGVTVKELADKMEVKAKDIIRILMMRGVLVTVNMALDPELAKTIAVEFGYAPEVVSFEKDLQLQEEERALETIETTTEEEEVARPPVVTVMGHVDHGKTSLLDAIRQTDVAAGEAGGITQSVGAYQVEINGRKITFIDTPGHEAFTSMRSRGAQVTDVVVLVVAASDGVMPQTVEAIDHAKAAGVPLIVAINKIDLPNARPERVKTELMSHGILVEEFGGEVVSVLVSARQKTNLESLLEMILLTADIRDLKASPRRRALGTVLEAGIDRGLGPFANVIVQDGTLRTGDAFIVGAEVGRVRALLDDRGRRLEEALPSTPVQVTGLQGVPRSGDRFQVVESEARAKEISEFRQHKRREAELAKSVARGTLQDLSKAIAAGETKELPIVVKADVHGAVEVLSKTLLELSTEKVRTKIIHAGTGAITDSDVLLASASKAIIVGFNVRPERGAAELADREKVIIRLHEVIYELTDEMKKLMAGLLDVVREEEFIGRAEVRQTFKVSRVGTVAGCYVQDGKITRGSEIRLVRDGVGIWQGKLATLKRFKDDVREVTAGLECGIALQDFNDVKVGDSVEAFTVREFQPTSIE